jgi:peptide/nickel transport system substrate-binding protein
MTRPPLRLPPCPRAHRWALITLAAAALAGCTGSDSRSAGSGDVGGTLVISIPGEVGTLVPGLMSTQADREVTDLLFDRLADISDDMNTIGDKGFKPQLAERWQWSPDSLSIAFKLNPKARWHDGQPVRASDVRYSLALMKDSTFGSPAIALIANVDSVSVRDSLTPVVWFGKRTPEQFYDFVYQVLIVPQHILGNTPASQLKTADVARRGIGSGRFRLAAWQPGQRLEIIADTGNYRGRAKLDRVVFASSPDFNSAATRFFSGEADMFEQLRPEQISKVLSDSQRKIMRYPSFQYAYLAFNLVDPKQTSRPHPIFGERAVRRALSMAVNRPAMLRNVFDTIGTPIHGPFPPTVSVADSGLAQIPYDTTKARALLDSAGWVPGPDGVRVKNGRRLEFGISTPNSSAARHQYAVLLQDAFRRVGAAARLDETDFATYSAKQGTHGFDTEMAVYVTDPSPTGFKQSWSTAGIGRDGSNFPSYSNPAVDALLDSAATAFDPARTKSYARRAFEIIIDDAPGIWLYQPLTVAGLHKRIRTTRPRTDGYWSGLADWWIPAGERTARDQIGLRAAQ